MAYSVLKSSTISRRIPNFQGIEDVIYAGIQQNVFPAAAILIKSGGEEVFTNCYGSLLPIVQSEQGLPVTLDTVFDLGNFTSVFATTSILMRLVANHHVMLSDQVIRFQQNFSVKGKAGITIGDLLFHISGLDASRPYYEDLNKESYKKGLGLMNNPAAREYILNRINRSTLRYKPQSLQLYSELGMILLGCIIEQITGSDLDVTAAEYIFKPLELNSTGFINLAQLKNKQFLVEKEKIAPGENCQWRKKALWGEVSDDNTWAMGGVSGNAGVFSNIYDLGRFSCEILSAYVGESAYFNQNTLRQFWAFEGSENLHFVAGWEKPNHENDLISLGFSPESRGFNSDTGCLFWLDPEQELEIIFLSNANCPARNLRKFRSFQATLLETISASL